MTLTELSNLIPALAFAAIALWITGFIALALRRQHFVKHYRFPIGLRIRLKKHYPQFTDAQWSEILDGLRDWFLVAQLASKRPISMPSHAVDTAWHEFILFTRDYHRFCARGLGRYLHHVPAEAMRAPDRVQEGIRRVWRWACALERISPRTPQRLPRLFALDTRLAFPGGFTYALDCRLDERAHCASGIGCGGSCGSSCGDGGDGGGGGCGD